MVLLVFFLWSFLFIIIYIIDRIILFILLILLLFELLRGKKEVWKFGGFCSGESIKKEMGFYCFWFVVL